VARAVKRYNFQFPLRRLFIATIWFALAAWEFSEFERTGRTNLPLVFGFYAAVGAGFGAFVGRVMLGALIAVIIAAMSAHHRIVE
jgi:hypothetical protein